MNRQTASPRRTLAGSVRRQFFFLLAALLVLLTTGPAAAQGPLESEALVLVVRDTGGSPLVGIGIALYLAGPPHTPYRQGLTGEDGTVHFLAYPADYVVAFGGGWGGQSLIPPAQQNGGAQTHDEVGGFGLHLEPQTNGAEHVFTFVLARGGDGQLVPLFDLSRDAALLPEPFLMDGPLDEETSVVVDQALDLSPLVEREDAAPTAPPTADPAPDADDQDAPSTGLPLLHLLAALALAAALAVLVALWLRGRAGHGNRRS